MKKQNKRILAASLIVVGALSAFFLAPYLFFLLMTLDFSHDPTVVVTYTNASGEAQTVECSLIEQFEDGTYIVKKDPRWPLWIHVLNDGYVIEHVDNIFEEYLCDISAVAPDGGESGSFSDEPGFFVKYAVAPGRGLVYHLLSVAPPEEPYLYRLEKNGETWYYVDYDRWVYFDFTTRQSVYFPSEEEALQYCSKCEIAPGPWHDRSDLLKEYTVVNAG